MSVQEWWKMTWDSAALICLSAENPSRDLDLNSSRTTMTRSTASKPSALRVKSNHFPETHAKVAGNLRAPAFAFVEC